MLAVMLLAAAAAAEEPVAPDAAGDANSEPAPPPGWLPPAAPSAPPPPAPEPWGEAAECTDERFMLAAILDLFDPAAGPEERARAARVLGGAGDPRAAEPLAFALRDREEPVRLAAAAALGSHRGPTAREALGRALTNEREDDRVRVAAIDSLARHADDAAAEILWNARAELEEDLRLAAERALSERFPDYVASRGGLAPVADARGRWLMVAAGAGFGGFGLGVLGDLAGAGNLFPMIGSGVILGAGTPWLLTLDKGLTLGDAMVITSSGVWGTILAAWTADLFQAPERPFGCPMCPLQAPSTRALDQWMWLAGEAAGLGLGVLAAPRLRFSAGDALFTDFGALASTLAMMGTLLQLDPRDDDRPGKAFILGSAIVGLGVSGWLAPRLRFEPGDLATLAFAVAWGGWNGPWLVDLIRRDNRDDPLLGGFLLGSALGFGAGSLLGALKSPGVSDAGFALFSAVLGTMAGAGAGFVGTTGDQDRVVSATMLVTGWLGVGAAAALSDRVAFTPGDAVTTALGVGWGLWQGIGIPMGFFQGGERESRILGGGILLGTALGGAAAAAAVQGVDLTPYEALMVASGGVWGSWIAGWGLIALDAGDRRALQAAVLTGDAGLVLTAILVAVGVDPVKMGWVNLGGGLGMALGTSAGTVVGGDSGHPIAAGNVIGTLLGMGVGAILANVL